MCGYYDHKHDCSYLIIRVHLRLKGIFLEKSIASILGHLLAQAYGLIVDPITGSTRSADAIYNTVCFQKRQRYHVTSCIRPGSPEYTGSRSRPYPPSPLIPITSHNHHGATLIPIDLACEMILLHSPCSPNPDNRDSDCLMRAISYTCFNDTCPTVS